MSSPSTAAKNQAQAVPASQRITFTSCVECGVLEEGTIRLVESLRRYGGEFAKAKFVAVTPRLGPSLARATLRRFAELGVDYVRIAPRNRYAWQPYMNKYFALKEAEKRATGDLVAWLDSDVLVMRPPTEMLLAPDQDFGACPRDKNIGSSGRDDQFEPYWTKICADVGLSVDDLPWVQTTADNQRIRLYWNAGIFVYRPASGFADAWRRSIEKVLDKTDASNLIKVFWTDQVALSVTAVLAKLRTSHLPNSLNYGIASHFKDYLSPEGLGGAKLLHYHDCMNDENWPWFMDRLAGTRPDVREWLMELGPVRDETDPGRQAVKNAYKAARQIRRRIWSQRHGGGLLGQ